MEPWLVFFGLAALIGWAIRVTVGLRLRAVARRSDVTQGDVCQLEQASRISSVAAIGSLVGLAVVAAVYLVFMFP